MKHDDLGTRMKEYEDVFRFHLPKRLPVIIRVDGRAFHTFTKGFMRPFDKILMLSMQETALNLCQNIAGTKLGYVQSDEISLVLTNDDTVNTQPWFDNNLQKLASVTASMAVYYFHQAMGQHIFNLCNTIWLKDEEREFIEATYGFTKAQMQSPEWEEYFLKVQRAHNKGAFFDARSFVLPKDEVVNYFIWRQQDATRNSIQMVAQSLYSHKELQGKNSSDLQEMIHQKGINWNDYPVSCKRGTCVVKSQYEVRGVLRHKWEIDESIPVFTADRQYIEGRVIHDE